MAQGDVLYRDLWEPHPPGIILLTAIFHLLLPPGTATVRLVCFFLALSVTGLSIHALILFRADKFFIYVAVSVTLFAHYVLMGMLRPETLLVVCSVATVNFTLASVIRDRRYAGLAGLAAGIGILSKPGIIAAIAVAVVILLCAEGRRRLLVMFGSTLVVAPALFMAWLLLTGSFEAAWDSNVVYGRYYFTPLTLDAMAKFVRHGVLWPHRIWELLPLAFAVSFLPLWAPRMFGLIPGLKRPRTALFALFILWPLLELLACLPQTTMFVYIFDNYSAAMLYLLAISGYFLVSAGSVDQGGLFRFVGICGALALLCFVTTADGPTMSAVSFAALLGGIALMVRTRIRTTVVKLMLCALLIEIPFIIRAAGVLQPISVGADFAPWRGFATNGAEELFAAKLKSVRDVVGGRLLNITPSPSMAYLANWPLAIRYHVSVPLYVSPYCALHKCWADVLAQLRKGDVHIVLDWPEWHDLRNAAAVDDTAYKAVTQELASGYALAAIVDVPYGSPVRIYADRGSFDVVGAVFGANHEAALPEEPRAMGVPHCGVTGDIEANDGTGRRAVFRNGTWILYRNGCTRAGEWHFGAAGDLPVIGRWRTKEQACAGVFRSGEWFLDSDCSGTWNASDTRIAHFGSPGDTPVAGIGTTMAATRLVCFATATGFSTVTETALWIRRTQSSLFVRSDSPVNIKHSRCRIFCAWYSCRSIDNPHPPIPRLPSTRKRLSKT